MGKVLLAAGGTGGHVFPAQAMAEALLKEGFEVEVITDQRGVRLFNLSSQVKMYVLPLGHLHPNKYLRPFLKIFSLFLSFFKALYWLKKNSPQVTLGFGGYPSLPSLMAAVCWRIPTLLHEQNAVLGRSNKLLAPFVNFIALPFKNVRGAEKFFHKTGVTGNPVRQDFLNTKSSPYKAWQRGKPFNLVIMGGSQGAKIFTQVVPKAVIELNFEIPFNIVHQCRLEDIEAVENLYKTAGVKAQVVPFIKEVPSLLKEAHLTISRAGASTVSELLILNRPALLVPFAGAMDNHQVFNAHELVALNKA